MTQLTIIHYIYEIDKQFSRHYMMANIIYKYPLQLAIPHIVKTLPLYYLVDSVKSAAVLRIRCSILESNWLLSRSRNLQSVLVKLAFTNFKVWCYIWVIIQYVAIVFKIRKGRKKRIFLLKILQRFTLRILASLIPVILLDSFELNSKIWQKVQRKL